MVVSLPGPFTRPAWARDAIVARITAHARREANRFMLTSVESGWWVAHVHQLNGTTGRERTKNCCRAQLSLAGLIRRRDWSRQTRPRRTDARRQTDRAVPRCAAIGL